MKKTGKKSAKRNWQAYFLLVVTGIYIIVGVADPYIALLSLKESYNIIKGLFVPLAFMIIIMALMDYIVNPQTLVKHFGVKSGKKAWLFAIAAGVISSGPIYMWYPLLGDLKRRGVRKALISVFLYNRAVKLPLLPVIASYFGMAYALVLWLVMIILSVPEGILTEKIEILIS